MRSVLSRRLAQLLAFVSAVLIVAAANLFLSVQADSSQPLLSQSNVAFERGHIAIVRAGTGEQIPFQVEVARTPDQHAQGLMFRDSVPSGTGMVFVFNPPVSVSFWMKNTRIPLDLFFVGANGQIEKIIPMAKPYDLTQMISSGPVAYVFEIAGGETQRMGIKVGDILRFGVE